MQSLNDVREAFLGFFSGHNHERVASSPLVPHNDPSLMFVNAGMVPFKNVFTGLEKRSYNRAVSSQKCVRAGGKHNDLENVGYTARHHTFFEMLGNFSFGDYFKEMAIIYAWDFVTKTLGLNPDKLLATVYAEDDEAYKLWSKIIPESRIIRIGTSDNFWSMGDTGPCGPCSEIFYDHGDHIHGGPPGSPDEDGDRFIEIWNLVFMQFDQQAGGVRTPLPKPSIDTGMGLERVTTVMQGVHDNYQIDLFRALIRASESVMGAKAEGEALSSHKVIADHLRAMSFLIADGVLPSNEGRGYVLRRIMRRAMRHAHHLQKGGGAKQPVIFKLVAELINQMGKAYPELGRAQTLITETVELEEKRFGETLTKGLKILDDEISKIGSNKTLPGESAFRLYDTYGFPLDLTADILRGRGLSVDEAGFEQSMKRQKEEARKSWSGSGEQASGKIWFEIRDKVGTTEFLGYSLEKADCKVLSIVKDGAEVEQASIGDEISFITNQTPFYAESGGQAGDKGTGELSAADTQIIVNYTTKPLADIHVHQAKITRGTLKLGDNITLHVDGARRRKLRANHSATHLLHKALRKLLGDHVTQKGSLVEEDKLRFDFSHTKSVDGEILTKVENEVNNMILQNAETSTRLMTPDEAIKAGAMALFGEKYGDEVRVVSMGIDCDEHFDDYYSVELCGGTHVRKTGDIGLFKITSESSVASGVRRIEAITGMAVIEYLREKEDILAQAASRLKAAPSDLVSRISAISDELKKNAQELSELRKAKALGGGLGAGSSSDGANGIGNQPEKINGTNFIGKVFAGVPAKDLKPLVDELKNQVKSGVVVAVTDDGGKASVVIGVTADLTGKYNASELIKLATSAVGGAGGGGRPDMAQGGGADISNLQAAISAVRELIV